MLVCCYVLTVVLYVVCLKRMVIHKTNGPVLFQMVGK